MMFKKLYVRLVFLLLTFWAFPYISIVKAGDVTYYDVYGNKISEAEHKKRKNRTAEESNLADPDITNNKIREPETQEIERLITKYGKPSIINLILEERNNFITLSVGNELREFSGNPNGEYVTPRTILINIRDMGLTLESLEKALQDRIVRIAKQKAIRKQLIKDAVPVQRVARIVGDEHSGDARLSVDSDDSWDTGPNYQQPNSGNNSLQKKRERRIKMIKRYRESIPKTEKSIQDLEAKLEEWERKPMSYYRRYTFSDGQNGRPDSYGKCWKPIGFEVVEVECTKKRLTPEEAKQRMLRGKRKDIGEQKEKLRLMRQRLAKFEKIYGKSS